MNQHPDGRLAAGYGVGRWIVHRAMERSELDILQLSTRTPDEILGMVE